VRGIRVELRLLVAIAALALAACGSNDTVPTRSPSPTEATTSPQEQSLEGGELLRALRSGGFVIYLRHAATEATSDTDLQNLSNCSTQRNLSEEGREQARRIGRSFRELGIPVGTVQSSALCRTMETANLAYGRAEQSLDLTALPQAGSQAEEERRVAALRKLLATPPPAGQNTVLVAHLFNIQRAAGISIAEGEAALVRPRNDGFTVVSTVSAEEWETLGR
jgi:phosphohistidine phosphatase SixA